MVRCQFPSAHSFRRIVLISQSILALVLGGIGCGGGKESTQNPDEVGFALTPIGWEKVPQMRDDGDKESLAKAASENLKWLLAQPPEKTFTFGTRTLTALDLVAGQNLFMQILRENENYDDLNR